jgi:peptidoglycan-N-acetylglucosamine deacetylase
MEFHGEKPKASLSLDLDNKWAYLKTQGNSAWQSFPSYLDVVVPRVLDFLKRRSLTITFFIVGQDAALEKNWDALTPIASAGHEIGNHSFHHEPWLHLYSEEQIEVELSRAEEHIQRVTGRRPIGFRGPGFALSGAILKVLARRGYDYDASTLPTFLGPLARAYFFMTASLRPERRQQLQTLFGNFVEGLRPIAPYRWQLQEGGLIEIPVTTMPLLRLPIHASYIMYLSKYSPSLGLYYFRAALKLCEWAGIQPSFLLHPTDFLGCDDEPEMSFHPAMELPSEKKLVIISKVIDALTAQFTIVTMQKHAEQVAAGFNVPVVEASFSQPA